MDIPQITINGKTYRMPKKPKMNLWRHLVKFEEDQRTGEIQGQQVLDEMYNLVAIAFNNEEVTGEVVEANFDFEEIINVFTYIREYVKKLAALKIAQLPKNAIAPART